LKFNQLSTTLYTLIHKITLLQFINLLQLNFLENYYFCKLKQNSINSTNIIKLI